MSSILAKYHMGRLGMMDGSGKQQEAEEDSGMSIGGELLKTALADERIQSKMGEVVDRVKTRRAERQDAKDRERADLSDTSSLNAPPTQSMA